MLKKRNLILIIMIVLLIIPIYSYFKYAENKTVLENNYTKKSEDSSLSIMYETKAGSGEYVVVDDTTWPGDGYIFNEEKSNCQNGSKLIWNEETKTVSVKVDISDKCYVYFDKEITLAEVCQGQNMANCIAAYYKLDSSIIHHDGTVKDVTYGTIDAEDNSYRYSGSSEEVSNFVCFGSDAEKCPNDNLYRIIGVFNETNIETGQTEKRVKLIKYDYALTNLLGTDGEYKGGYKANGYDASYYRGQTEVSTIPGYYFNTANGESSTNDWTLSRLNTVNLNINYINNIDENWADKIAQTTWKIGGMTWAQGGGASNIAKTSYNYELGTNSIDKTYQAKIGLIYMSDYYYAADTTYWTYYGYNSEATKDYRVAIESNWMYMGLYEWSITPRTDDSNDAFTVNHIGSSSDANVYNNALGVRPSFYLKSSIILSSGSGTKSDSYRIM